MLVFRTNKKGNCLMNAKPCNNCMKYMDKIKEKGYIIQNIYYTNESGDIKKFELKIIFLII